MKFHELGGRTARAELNGGHRLAIHPKICYGDSIAKLAFHNGTLVMGPKRKKTEEPLGEIEIDLDFLPLPEELAFREESVKVTLTLSKKSVDFFKAEAAKYNTQYQRMIRQLLDAYVARVSSKRLAALAGSQPHLDQIPRRR